MKNIILVQPNFKIGSGSFTGYWLPYSVGCIWAYAQQYAWVNENFSVVDIVFRRNKVKEYVQNLQDIDCAFFSCYMWNWEYNKKLAKEIKKKFPNCKIIFGGPQIPNDPYASNFFAKEDYVDCVCLVEGEYSFINILEQILHNQKLHKVYNGKRVSDLDIPSPYLTGVFDQILADNPNVVFNTTVETNRGCPFACTFCDWGSLTYAKIKKFPLEKVFAELEWMAKNSIDYLTIADANFGVFYERDMEITDYLIKLQKKYGFPKVVDATWYKNSSDKILNIVKKFAASGFNRGLTLSVQSMDERVLDEIKRKNMEISDLKSIFDRCNKEDIKSYTELILGLPYETYDTWCNGLCSIIEAGQHGTIESWFANMLENAELNNTQQRTKHQIQTIVANDYVTGHEEEDDIKESAELVVSTKYMNRQQFIDSWGYSWVINNFHCFGWAQVYTRYLHHKGHSYRDMYDRVLDYIKADGGIVNKLYTASIDDTAYYLKNGNYSNPNGGATLLWQAQKIFHINRQQILDFVDSVFCKEFYNLEDDFYKELQKYQHAFTTDPDKNYPYTIDCDYNFAEFLKGQDLTQKSNTYTIDIQESKLDKNEYIERLYFRRRQGWGKSVIGVNNG